MNVRDHAAGLEMIVGSIFSGKSEELIRRVKRGLIVRRAVQVFKPGSTTATGDRPFARRRQRHGHARARGFRDTEPRRPRHVGRRPSTRRSSFRPDIAGVARPLSAEGRRVLCAASTSTSAASPSTRCRSSSPSPSASTSSPPSAWCAASRRRARSASSTACPLPTRIRSSSSEARRATRGSCEAPNQSPEERRREVALRGTRRPAVAATRCRGARSHRRGRSRGRARAGRGTIDA